MTETMWSPIHEDDVPLAWPSRQAFLDWLGERDRNVAVDARHAERIRADRAADDWMKDNQNYVNIADRLLARLRYALAFACREEGL